MTNSYITFATVCEARARVLLEIKISCDARAHLHRSPFHPAQRPGYVSCWWMFCLVVCSIYNIIDAEKMQTELLPKYPTFYTKTVLMQRSFDIETSFVDSSPRKVLSWVPLISWIVLTCIKTQRNRHLYIVGRPILILY